MQLEHTINIYSIFIIASLIVGNYLFSNYGEVSQIGKGLGY